MMDCGPTWDSLTYKLYNNIFRLTKKKLLQAEKEGKGRESLKLMTTFDLSFLSKSQRMGWGYFALVNYRNMVSSTWSIQLFSPHLFLIIFILVLVIKHGLIEKHCFSSNFCNNKIIIFIHLGSPEWCLKRLPPW